MALAIGPLLAVTLSACSLFGDDNPTVSSPHALSPAPIVLSTGRDPRQPLRLGLRSNTTEVVDLTVDVGVVQTDGAGNGQASGGSREVVDPTPVTERISFRVGARKGDSYEVSFRIIDVNIDRAGTNLTDAQFVTLTGSVQKLKGLGGRGAVSATGRVSKFRYDVPKGVDEAIAQTLRSTRDQLGRLIVVLPTQAMGVGGRWRTVTQVEVAGVSLRQTATYQLTGVTDRAIAYRTRVTQDAGEQSETTKLADGTTVTLLSSSFEGNATGELPRHGLFGRAQSSLRGSQVLDQKRGTAPTQRISQEIQIDVSVAPVTP